MHYTKHALKRIRQRGFRESDLELIEDVGEPVRRPGGATEYRLTRAMAQRQVGKLKRHITTIERLKGTAVLVSDDGDVLTVYHLTR